MPLQGRIGWRTSTSTPVLDRFLNSAGSYSLRKLSNNYSGSAIRVRRSLDNAEQNIGFDASGNLDTSALTAFTTVADTTTTKLLDSISNSAAAYSLRKLRSAYSGSVIRVRRSSDNTEQNIGFDASGGLDQVALLAFVGSGSGFVTTWYDQSGLGRDVTQTTAGSQPRIVNAGVVDTLLGKPSLYFDGVDDCLDRTDAGMPTLGTTVAHISKYASGSVGQAFVVNWGSGSAGQAFYNMYFGTGIGLSNYGESFSVSSRLNVNNLTVVTKPNATGYQSWKLYVNSTSTNALSMNSVTTLLNSAGGFRIGRVNPSQGNTYAMLGNISEVVVWPSDLDSQRTLIESNLNSFYSVYTPTADAFVTTWYDQSGNSRNLTQTTAASQPQIVSAGTIVTSNGKSAISFTGGRFVSGSVPRSNTNAAMSMYAVYRLYSTVRQGQFQWGSLDLEPGANSSGVALHYFGNWAYSPNNAAYWSTDLALASVTFTGGTVSNASIYYNGVYRAASVTNGGNGNVQAGGTLNIGKGSYSSANSAISEVILYPTGDQNANVAAINQSINAYYGIYAEDSDAQAFVSAAGLSNGDQIRAIDTLVTSLKSANLWTKMKAIYPFVGGNATAHQFNLKDPRNVDAAFRLGFAGGMTHTSAGAVPNGSNSYAATYLTPSVSLTSSQHISFYSSTNRGTSITNTSGEIEIGAVNSGTGIPGVSMGFNSTSWNSGTPNYFLARLSGGGYGSFGLTPIADTRGFGMLSRTDVNTVKAFWNGSLYGQNSQSYIAVPTPLSIFGRAYNVTGAEGYTISRKTCGFASIGDGLTDTEAATLYTIVQAYQTALGRQV